MPDWIVPLAQVLFIDLVLAGDNAIVVGMAAAGLPVEQRRKAIFWGIIAATIMRIGFAAVTAQLLAIVGITLAGGVLLLWVCWKMFRELRSHDHVEALPEGEEAAVPAGKTLPQAITQILVADISMSLDNVLAVAGAAKDHTWVLVAGLAISVVLMGVAATLIANLLNKHRWIAWVGLRGDPVCRGGHDLAGHPPGRRPGAGRLCLPAAAARLPGAAACLPRLDLGGGDGGPGRRHRRPGHGDGHAAAALAQTQGLKFAVMSRRAGPEMACPSRLWAPPGRFTGRKRSPRVRRAGHPASIASTSGPELA